MVKKGDMKDFMLGSDEFLIRCYNLLEEELATCILLDKEPHLTIQNHQTQIDQEDLAISNCDSDPSIDSSFSFTSHLIPIHT